MQPKTERRTGEVIGRLIPGERLDTDAVYHVCGIGEAKLMELRRQGRIKAKLKFGRNWYRSDDLIELIDSED